MKPAVLSLFVALLPLLAQRPDFTREFAKTVPLNPGQRFEIDHQMGSITIRTQPQKEVAIHATIETSAGSKEEAEKLSNQIEILLEQTASGVLVRTKYPDQTGWKIFGKGTSYSVRYDIVMPEGANLRLRNRFGAVSVTGLKGDGDIGNSNGRLEFRDGRGAQRIENSFGAVDVIGNQGDVTVNGGNGAVTVTDISGAVTASNRFGKVTVNRIGKGATIVNSNGSVEVADTGGLTSVTSSFGSVAATRVKGDLIVKNSNSSVDARGIAGSADLNTSFGAVTFFDIGGKLAASSTNGKIEGTKVGGAAELKTSFGSIDVGDVKAGVRAVSGNSGVTLRDVGEVYAKTSFGSIRVERAAGAVTAENSNGGIQVAGAKGAVSARSTFGAISLDGVGGAVDITNANGSVTVGGLTGTGCQPVIAKTTFGPIRVTLPASAAYDVTARTSFGRVKSDFGITMSGTMGEDVISGKIAAGGCELRLNGSNGSIEILKR
jgi:hypothetical protein